MREAIGGSLMIYLIIPIIVLLIFFVAFIMNYASAYRAANYVVTQLENCQGQVGNCNGIDMQTITEKVISEYKYIPAGRRPISPCYFESGNGYIFRVTLPVSFELPLVGNFNPIEVKSETKTISTMTQSTLTNFSKCESN